VTEASMNEMRQIRFDKLDALIEAGKDPHQIEHFRDRQYSEDIKADYADWEEKTVRVAGRILSRRGHGKVSFVHILDAKGQIQLFLKADVLGDGYEEAKHLDIGDIVGAEGEVFTTKTGEISVRVKEITLLTKSLTILPEKFHGLKDIDLRYRQRYVDLIINPEVRDTFRLRTRIISEIRRYLDDKGFLEVETPILNTIAGGATARPFVTHHNTLDIDMYLRIANELYLKRLIVGGFDKVYEMGRMFRNEGMDATHNPEYTAMELYQAYADYEDMMNITEDLVATVAERATGSMQVQYGDTLIDFTPPWRRVTMQELIKEHAGVDFAVIHTDEEARQVAKEHNLDLKKGNTRGFVINEMFETYCEEHLIQPTFVIGHPVEVSPLAKRNPEDPRVTQRFEAFVCQKEIANAFSELNDARDQRARFEHQVEMREGGDEEANMMDADFVYALEVGLPPTGGLGIGVDRLIMFLTNHDSIRDVLLFPTMKPIGKDTAEDEEENEENA
jgi:lysyl-tRNA synthetase class 2